jgi:DNA polymerase-3 subunit delta
MKLDARQVAGFLRDPGKCRMALLYGEDEGLIRERAQALTKRIAGSLNDPFLVTELSREGWGQIPAEMAALSMIGGRRVVVVRDAAEAVLGQVTQALKGPGGSLLVLEAPGIGKGKLRSFAESHPEAAAIACYADEGPGISDLIRSGLAASKVSIDPDALAWLGQVLGGDRAVLRGEIEKLALLAGAGGTIGLEDAQLCTGDSAAGSGDEGLLAALRGDAVAADTGVERAFQDGLNGVAMLRMALGQLQKLHQARLRMDGGLSASEAVRTMRPPVFYRAVSEMTACLGRWSSEGLVRAIEEARQVELACKRTGSRPELLARRFVAGLARGRR